MDIAEDELDGGLAVKTVHLSLEGYIEKFVFQKFLFEMSHFKANTLCAARIIANG